MNNNTVFVIGAGASNEANLPTGEKLKGMISKLLDIHIDDFNRPTGGDSLIINALRDHTKDPVNPNGDIMPYLHEARHIRDALPLAISIDNFIDSQRGNEKLALCGKLAIARSILQAERESLLFFKRDEPDENINFSLLENTWYLPFFKSIVANCGKNDLKVRFETITLIIFNYDRCIEHFLYCALQTYYKILPDESAELVKTIKIYHPYGSVGAYYPYGCVGISSLPNSQDAMDFGAEPDTWKLLRLANDIKTFTEGTDPNSSEIVAIRKHMGEAKRLVFLGFAFHTLNMQLIMPENYEGKKGKEFKCYASTFEVSESDNRVIENQINKLYKSTLDIQTANLTCADFFKEFWRSLAFS